MAITKVLFVCGRNRLHSPTAEQIFAGRRDLEVASAELNTDCDACLTSEHVAWADIIFVMEEAHRTKLQHRHGAALKSKPVVCLDIPDKYEYTDPALIRLIEKRALPKLPAPPNDATAPDQERDLCRKRIRIRAWRRGMREMDILMGGFVDGRLDALSDAEIAELESLLDLPDAELFHWLSGAGAPPPERDTPLLRKIVAFHRHEGPIH